MRLEDIGFYTLSDQRAATASPTSPLMRCELILTDACNFKCPYCRGLRKDLRGTMPFVKAHDIISKWADDGLRNIRFSGGEPTVYARLFGLVAYAHARGIERIAISTNGSADLDTYKALIDGGVNDFSISLDACCSSYGEEMSGGIKGVWERVVANIEALAKLTYISVGVVVTEETVGELVNVVKFAHDLGVADIRVISAAQYNSPLPNLAKIPADVLSKHPILRYRVGNLLSGRNVRGLTDSDNHRCPLAVDDMAVTGDYHFPCIIYMREGGDPIGNVSGNMRRERYQWYLDHDCYTDPICKNNCLDVCIDYNNKVRELNPILGVN